VQIVVVFQQNAKKANLLSNVRIVRGMSVVAGKTYIKNNQRRF
jgi:hypothetical protein